MAMGGGAVASREMRGRRIPQRLRFQNENFEAAPRRTDMHVFDANLGIGDEREEGKRFPPCPALPWLSTGRTRY
jgi:hypothetical protein